MGTDPDEIEAEDIGRRMGHAHFDFLDAMIELERLEGRLIDVLDRIDAARERMADAERRFFAASRQAADFADRRRTARLERAEIRRGLILQRMREAGVPIDAGDPDGD